MIATDMRSLARTRLLTAFDELTRITHGGPPLKRKRPRAGKGGNSVTCDHCGHPASVSGHECPVQHAVDALSPLLPKFEDRSRWVNAAYNQPPQEQTTTEAAPEAPPGFSLSMETRGIVIHGEAFVVEGALNVAAAWADLSEKLAALGIQVTRLGGGDEADEVTVIVNGNEQRLRERRVSYVDALAMAGYGPGDTRRGITVTYRNHGNDVGGSLVPNGGHIVVQEGTVFNVTDTSNA